jgi:hypothetical protein
MVGLGLVSPVSVKLPVLIERSEPYFTLARVIFGAFPADTNMGIRHECICREVSFLSRSEVICICKAREGITILYIPPRVVYNPLTWIFNTGFGAIYVPKFVVMFHTYSLVYVRW